MKNYFISLLITLPQSGVFSPDCRAKPETGKDYKTQPIKVYIISFSYF